MQCTYCGAAEPFWSAPTLGSFKSQAEFVSEYFCVSKRTLGVAEPIKNVWLEAVCEIRELHIFIETS